MAGQFSRKRRSVAAALALILSAAACDGAAERRAAERHEDGAALLAEGRAAEARAVFLEVLRLDPAHAPARRMLARLADTRGDWGGSVENWREVARLEPADVEARVRLVERMIEANDLEAARRFADEAAALAPDAADVNGALAALHAALDDPAEAARRIDLALAADPAHRRARLLRSGRLAAEHEVEAALATLDGLLAENPGDMDAALQKLDLLRDAGRDDALRAHLAAMAERHPDVWIKEWLAWLQEDAGDVAGAYRTLRALAGQQPAPERILAVVALIDRTEGREAGRRELLAHIEAADGDLAPELRLALADRDAAEGRAEAAAAALASLVDAAPDSAAADAARVRLAEARRRNGDAAAALGMVEEVLSRDARRPDALALRARLLLDRGAVAAAVTDLRTLLEETPDDVQTRLALAEAYVAGGWAELARAELAEAVAVSEHAPAAVDAYASFLLREGRRDAAVALIETAARQRPDEPAFHERLRALSP